MRVGLHFTAIREGVKYMACREPHRLAPIPVKQGGLDRALSVLLPLCSPEYDSNFAIGLNLFLGTVGVNVNLITASSLDGSRIVPSTRGLPLRLVCCCYMSTHYRCGC